MNKQRTYFALPADLIVGESMDAYNARKAALPRCTKAPTGWRCTREAGHSGPCAAVHESMEPAPILGWRVEHDLGPDYTSHQVQADQWIAEGRKVTPLVAQ